MKPHPILGAALTLVALVVPAHVPAQALPALAPPVVATVVPTALTLTAPDALAGLDFGVAAGYRREVFLAPRGWVRYGPGWPGLYATRWGGPFVYHPYRRSRSEAVMFEPRRPASPPPSPHASEPPRASSSRIVVPLQIHGGFFAHEENAPRSYAAGLRGGPAIDRHLQVGVGVDWYHRTDSEREVVADTLQAGQPVKVTRVLSQASSDLIPIQAFLQLSVGRGLVPYAGIAGEYQFLVLSATDHVTGAGYKANFGGLGWQAWGGLGLDIGRSRLFGEVFVNAGDVERDVRDPVSGTAYRESINADGGGLRCGLSWGF